MKPVISVEHLSKAYRLGQIGTGTFANDLLLWWAKKRGRPNPLSRIDEPDLDNLSGDTLWALKDVSFRVKQGQVLGIVGRNGAGKSTLLKILSRVTAPTSGRIRVKGRIASLLEVGTGFHPELSGRENIYLNGAILGMSRSEVDRKFDQIVDFAEIEKFIDTPVKRYSSGMYVRLAFAVAAHLEPEILVVDEVLAVGDAEFQKKCIGKMGDVAREGRTVLFVSHNMTAVQKLCTNCIWIDKGSVALMGEPSHVIESYLAKGHNHTVQGEVNLSGWVNRYGGGGAQIIAARILDTNSVISTKMFRTKPMNIEYDFVSESSHCLHFSASIMAESGESILHLSHHDTPGFEAETYNGLYRIRFFIPCLPLNEGNFRLLLGIHTENLIPIDVVRDVLPFEVYDIKESPRPYKTVVKYA
jgi:lipopolysaccharide transport system ATP-binding protein